MINKQTNSKELLYPVEIRYTSTIKIVLRDQMSVA